MKEKANYNTAAATAEITRPIGSVLTGEDSLIDLSGDARFVLIGEASHGTHEFYQTRAEISRRLIVEKGFRMLALEADWPDMLRIHRYITGEGDDSSPSEALEDFRCFPTWMWRNTVMVDFIRWLKEWNGDRSDPCGIFGMDLYSMHASIDAVLDYLNEADPEAAERARDRYFCFEHFGGNPQAYGHAPPEVARNRARTRWWHNSPSCGGSTASGWSGAGRADELLYAEQNARLVANAERYYRFMFQGRASSWNLRDKHMTETIDELVRHFDGGSRQRCPERIVFGFDRMDRETGPALARDGRPSVETEHHPTRRGS